jgi:hypothetical protein
METIFGGPEVAAVRVEKVGPLAPAKQPGKTVIHVTRKKAKINADLRNYSSSAGKKYYISKS